MATEIKLIKIPCYVLRSRPMDDNDLNKGYVLSCSQDLEHLFQVNSPVPYKTFSETNKEEELCCRYLQGTRKSDGKPFAFFSVVL